METTAARRRRCKRSKEAIEALLTEYAASGMTIVGFCAAKEIAPGSFHKWQSRYKEQQQKPEEPSSGFAELQVLPSVDYAGTALFAEVRGIRIFQPVTAAYLKELLS